MDKKFMFMLVIPLLLISVITMAINFVFPLDGFFINLSTEIIGIIFTVMYVDWSLRRHEEMKWKNVNIRLSEQLIIMVNTVLSSVRDACGYSFEDIVGVDGLYRLSRLDINGAAEELIKGTERIIEPNLLKSVANIDQSSWNTLIINIGNIHNACINYMSMYNNVLKPRQYELVSDLQNQSFKVCEHFRAYKDIILESDEDTIKKYGEEKIEFKNELILLGGRELLKLLEYTKELGNYQIQEQK